MTGTAVERHQGGTLATDRQYMEQQLPRIVEQLAHSAMCPETWRVAAGDSQQVAERKMGELAIIGQSLAEIDVRLGLNVLPQVYVVHGRRQYMAQLQIMLAARFGCHIVPLDEESGPERGVVKVFGKDREWHRVAVTLEDAQRAKWPDKNPNYRTMPDRMLMARAVTKAISQHCPEALMMLPPADRDELDGFSGDVDGETGEISAPGVDRMVPAQSVAPDGHTIPEHLREPAIDEAVRADLIARLEQLHPDQVEYVRAQAHEFGIPNLKSARVTRAHGALVARLIAEAAKNPTEKDGADSPDGNGSPASEEHEQAGSSSTVSAGESRQEPSESRASGRRRTSTSSAASGPGATPPEHVTPEVVDGPADQASLDYGPDEEPF